MSTSPIVDESADVRPPTMRQIAQRARVSAATVSMVLNGRKGIAADTRQRVLEVARELGYPVAARQPVEVPRDITLLIEKLPTAPTSDPFNRSILQGIQSAARRLGARISFEFASAEDESSIASFAATWGDGLIILGGGDLGPIWVRTALELGTPVVMADHFIPGVEVPTVVPDNFAGAYAATHHLIEQGHTRIGFIRGATKYWTLGERQAGYLLAMQQAGLGIAPDLVPPRQSHGSEKGYLETRTLLEMHHPPTAIFAVSDLTAANAYRAAAEFGVSIPDDLAIVGFDDTDAARMLVPGLTTVRNPGETLGRVALERLMGIITGTERPGETPIKWTIPTELVVRGSVAPPRP